MHVEVRFGGHVGCRMLDALRVIPNRRAGFDAPAPGRKKQKLNDGTLEKPVDSEDD